MKKQLGAGRILANIQSLKGFTTKRQLAEFFGVGPSAVTDWTNRKGDRIPARRLADASQNHGLRWEWLAYGEGHPHDSTTFDNATGIDLDAAEVALLARIKSSPSFRRAVNQLLGLPEERIRMIGQLAGALKPDGSASHLSSQTPCPAASGLASPEPAAPPPARAVPGSVDPSDPGSLAAGGGDLKSGQNQPFLKYNSRYP